MTQHSATYIRPMTQWTLTPGKGVLANTGGRATDDFMQGLDFNAISSPFDAYKPNAPKLSVKNGTYTITVGQLDLPVVVMLQWRFDDTGVWEQQFCVRIPVSDSPTGKTGAGVSSPLFWASDTGWQAYSPRLTTTATTNRGTPPPQRRPPWSPTARVMTRTASAATRTGIRKHHPERARRVGQQGVLSPTLYNAGDPGYFDYDGGRHGNRIMNVGCESCHGPGAQQRLGRRGSGQDR